MRTNCGERRAISLKRNEFNARVRIWCKFAFRAHFPPPFANATEASRKRRETEAGLRSLPSPIRLRRGPGAQCNRADLPEL